MAKKPPNLFTADQVVPLLPAVVLIDPKHADNVGRVLRACSCFGFRQLWWTGRRVRGDEMRGRLPREERMKGYRDVEMVRDERPIEHYSGYRPPPTVVAVELARDAENLAGFEHPDDAVYVFGPEDGGLEGHIKRLCHRFVFIPTAHCLNLSQAAAIVMWDRYLKRVQRGVEPYLTIDESLAAERRGPVGADVFFKGSLP